MTNKLPVVGKRYKDKSGLVFKLKAHSVIRSDYPDWWTEFYFEEMKISCPLRHFFENFEELPEDETETKQSQRCECGYKISTGGMFLGSCNSTPCSRKLNTEPRNAKIVGFDDSSKGGEPFYITKDDLSPEVKEAMEGLRNTIKIVTKILISPDQPPLEHDIFQALLSSRNLLNALDKQFKINEKKLSCRLCGGSGKLTSLTMPPAEIDCYKCNTKPCEVEIKLETQNPELSLEVKEAMEELKNQSEQDYTINPETVAEHEVWKLYIKLANLCDNLLNALDKQFANNKIQAEEVVDNKIEAENGSFKHLNNAEKISQDIMKESAVESIWKPVSELKGYDRHMKYAQFLGLFNLSNIKLIKNKDSENYFYLTDLINDYEKLKERVKKLEKNMSKPKKQII